MFLSIKPCLMSFYFWRLSSQDLDWAIGLEIEWFLVKLDCFDEEIIRRNDVGSEMTLFEAVKF